MKKNIIFLTSTILLSTGQIFCAEAILGDQQGASSDGAAAAPMNVDAPVKRVRAIPPTRLHSLLNNENTPKKRIQEEIDTLRANGTLATVINQQDSEGMTPLMLGLAKGKEKAIEILLDAGADPRMTNNCGKTPLIIVSAESQKLTIIKMLLDKIPAEHRLAYINQQDNEGNSALLCSYERASSDYLLSLGANPYVRNVSGKTIFFKQVYPTSFKKLIAECPLDILTQQNAEGLTAFTSVFGSSRVDYAKALVTRGVPFDDLDSNGNTPLMRIIGGFISEKMVYLVKFLVDRGALFNHPNNNGDTLLSLICKSRSNPEASNHTLELVKHLVNKGAIKNNTGKTPADYVCSVTADNIEYTDPAVISYVSAIQQPSSETKKASVSTIVDVYLEYNTDKARELLDLFTQDPLFESSYTEIKTRNGYSLLSVALLRENHALAEKLLEHGASIKEDPVSLDSPLGTACASISGNARAALMLLVKGANPRGLSSFMVQKTLLSNPPSEPFFIFSKNCCTLLQVALYHLKNDDPITKKVFEYFAACGDTFPLNFIPERFLEKVKLLRERDKAIKFCIPAPDSQYTFLHLAAKYNNIPAVKVLLEKRAVQLAQKEAVHAKRRLLE